MVCNSKKDKVETISWIQTKDGKNTDNVRALANVCVCFFFFLIKSIAGKAGKLIIECTIIGV